MKKLITMIICLVMAMEVTTGSGSYARAQNLSKSQSSPNSSENSQDNITAAEIDHVDASIDSNKIVTVKGIITSGAGHQVTLRITDPKGKLEYANNTSSTMGGNFIFSYTMTNMLYGKYNVSLGGTGISAPATASFNYGNDAELSNLSISGGTFDKAFESETTYYTASLNNSVTSITVTPILSDANAKVSINNTSALSGKASAPISLREGASTINVVVTAQDGITSKAYTITVERKKVAITAAATVDSKNKVTVSGVITSGAGQQVTLRITDPNGDLEYADNTTSTVDGNFTFSYTMTKQLFGKYTVSLGGTGIPTPTAVYFNYGVDADLSNLSISSGAFDQIFSAETTSYTASVDNNVTSITITPTLSDENAKVSVENTNVLSGQASIPISLKEGSNTINVVVTARNQFIMKAYTITVVRNKAGVTSVTNINASIDTNKKVIVDGAVSSKTGKMVTLKITDPEGNLEYMDNTVSSKTGSFTFSYIMDNTLKGKYKAAIGGTGIAAPSVTYFYYGPDAYLNNLTLSSGVLSPAFEKDTVSYSASVDYDVSNIMVTPVLSDSNASVSVNGIGIMNGQASVPIKLDCGNNIINLIVTAQDGITMKNYTITVYKDAPPPLPQPSPQPTPSLQPSPSPELSPSPQPSAPPEPSASPEPSVSPEPSAPPEPSQAPTMSSDATLSHLLLNSGDTLLYSDSTCMNHINFNSETTSYYANITSVASSITIKPIVNDEVHATVTVNGYTVAYGDSVSLAKSSIMEGLSNAINVVVTAEDGTKKTYTITCVETSTLPGDAALSNLELSVNGGSIPINFAPGTTTYSVTIAHGTTVLLVTPTTNDENATITVSGTPVANSSSASLAIGELMDGTQYAIYVEVTANGTSRMYTIIIVKNPV